VNTPPLETSAPLLHWLKTAYVPENLDKDKEHELIAQAQQGDLTARDRLTACNLAFIAKWAKRYRGTLPVDDAVQEGVMGFWRAIEKFDLALGRRLKTYAAWWVRCFIGRAAGRDTLIRLPQNIHGPHREEASRAMDVRGGDWFAADDGDPEDGRDDIADIVEAEHRQVTARRVRRTLKRVRRMKPKCGRVLYWRFLRGKTQREVGEKIGTHKGYVGELEREAKRMAAWMW
jgi:RNA polymerase sigma factor (sigma-70 family)